MSGSPYADLSRPPLHPAQLRRALVVPGGVWTEVSVVERTGSTNADLARRAQSGAGAGAVLIAERQTAGRGRSGRAWAAPARAGLTLSVLLRPDRVPPRRLGWLPLLAGVALVEAVGRVAVVDAALKWPNDLLVRSASGEGEYGKCAGVLAEAVANPDGAGPPAVVLGIGLNVSQQVEELPPAAGPTAYRPTSLALAGAACTDRDPLLRALLRGLAGWYERWCGVDGDPDAAGGLRQAYRQRCATLGRTVRVLLPGDRTIVGAASDVDPDGRLLVTTADGTLRPVAAGDVVHVR